MPKALVVAFGPESLLYVRRSRQIGLQVRVLDCFDVHHQRLVQWFGEDVLQTPGRRTSVRDAVEAEGFDCAIVHEQEDFIRTALITQSLREAGVRSIIVVTADSSRRSMYRRCGAHRIVAANSAEQAWLLFSRYLPSFATA